MLSPGEQNTGMRQFCSESVLVFLLRVCFAACFFTAKAPLMHPTLVELLPNATGEEEERVADARKQERRKFPNTQLTSTHR